jgi:hypothetical protein
MRHALSDPLLLGRILEGESWFGWRTILIAMNGEVLTDEERVTFTAVTGRDREPGAPVEEFWGVIGRRGGKSRAMSVLAVYLAALCDHPAFAPGERGVVALMAASKQQAAVAFKYVSAILSRPPFDGLKVLETADSISLLNGVDLQVRPASFRTIRGISAVAVIADEVAYWYGTDENSTKPDSEILNDRCRKINGRMRPGE